MRDASGYYLLGYTSTSAPTDGKFHNIDVRVKRPNVEVRARKGYWAYTRRGRRAARRRRPKPGPPPAVSNALNAIAEPARGRPRARFWIGTDRGPGGGQSRVTFVWEPIAAVGDRRRGRPTRPARVMLTATGRRRPPGLPRPRPDDATRRHQRLRPPMARQRSPRAAAAGAQRLVRRAAGSARAADHGRRRDAGR